MKVNINDNLFTNNKCISGLEENKYVETSNIEWNHINEKNKSLFFSEGSDWQGYEKDKYGLMIESPEINRELQNKMLEGEFKNIFTFRRDLLEKDVRCIPYYLGGTWIGDNDFKIHEKNKLLSFILSHKTQTYGHKFRHDCLNIVKELFNNQIDIYGRGINPINNKIDGLKEYMFSIAIENCKEDYYFSEKLIDCFVTGTVPIYYGCPSIGEFFDIRGMITIDSPNDLYNINLSGKLYKSMLPYIEDNYNTAISNYLLPENYIFNKLNLIK